mmetsp:Transcript_1346/g.2561  ORF Transcript_1346/g.2561 Transcript_1346/m.2561 type:complete len:85 (+) Transcript_1346:710-964(+)
MSAMTPAALVQIPVLPVNPVLVPITFIVPYQQALKVNGVAVSGLLKVLYSMQLVIATATNVATNHAGPNSLHQRVIDVAALLNN